MHAVNLLPLAVEKNVAYVPGAAFYSGAAQEHTLRLSFVTASVEQINVGIAALAQVFKEALP
jgi:2-aminoadipate transaminase